MKLRNKKTGEIVDTHDRNFTIATPTDPLYGYDAYDVRQEYATLAALNEEWEDYEPAEPLIKDEKVRKAVRAWAEVHDTTTVEYGELKHSLSDWRASELQIRFNCPLELEDGKNYTIDELCGEEEE